MENYIDSSLIKVDKAKFKRWGGKKGMRIKAGYKKTAVPFGTAVTVKITQ